MGKDIIKSGVMDARKNETPEWFTTEMNIIKSEICVRASKTNI